MVHDRLARARRPRPNTSAVVLGAAKARPCQDGRFGLGAKTFERLNCWPSAGRAEFVERGDFQFLESMAAFFGPKPGTRSNAQHAFGNGGPQFVEHRQLPGANSVAIFSARSLPMPVDIGQRCARDRPRSLRPIRADRGSCGPRCDRRARGTDWPPEIQQIGDLVEDGGDFASWSCEYV